MLKYTIEQEKIINDYLTECVKNNSRCQHCYNNHDNICFFAFKCFCSDGMFFNDFDDDDDDYKEFYII